jgi:hypothetical protein
MENSFEQDHENYLKSKFGIEKPFNNEPLSSENNELDFEDQHKNFLQSYETDSYSSDPSLSQRREPSVVAGAITGSGAATTRAVVEGAKRSSEAVPMARLAYNVYKGRMPAALSMAQSISQIAPQLNQNQIFTILSKVPEGGSATFNYAKQFGLSDAQAMKISSMSEAQDIVKSRQAGISKAQELFPSFSPRSSGSMIAVPDDVGSGPSTRFAGQQARVPLPPPPVAQSGLSAAGDMVSGAVKSIGGNILKSGLAGAGTGFGAAEAYRNYKEGDIPSSVLNAMGALGSSVMGAAPYLSKAAAFAPYAGPVATLAPLTALAVQGGKAERKRNIPAKQSYLSREKRFAETTPEEIEFIEREMGPATSRQGLGFRP